MSNHYHLLVETVQPTLSKGMRFLNGVYTQRFNARNRRVGHIFQGRYKSIVVQSDAYLLELARYIVLNPVRARMVHRAEDWPWSSYCATVGLSSAHAALTTDWVLSQFGNDRTMATSAYRNFIQAGKNQPSPWEQLKNQIYLGSDEFITNVLQYIDQPQKLRQIPRLQKSQPPLSLDYYSEKYADRNHAMSEAYLSGHYSQADIGQHFSVGRSTVARAVKEFTRGG